MTDTQRAEIFTQALDLATNHLEKNLGEVTRHDILILTKICAARVAFEFMDYPELSDTLVSLMMIDLTKTLSLFLQANKGKLAVMQAESIVAMMKDPKPE